MDNKEDFHSNNNNGNDDGRGNNFGFYGAQQNPNVDINPDHYLNKSITTLNEHNKILNENLRVVDQGQQNQNGGLNKVTVHEMLLNKVPSLLPTMI